MTSAEAMVRCQVGALKIQVNTRWPTAPATYQHPSVGKTMLVGAHPDLRRQARRWSCGFWPLAIYGLLDDDQDAPGPSRRAASAATS